MTASEAEVGTLELDAGDAPTFSVAVEPYGSDTAMAAQLTDPAGVATPFSMTPNADKSIWAGTGPALGAPGEYTAQFTVAGTGAGVKYWTVIVATPPPLTTDLRQVRLLISDNDPANRLFRVDQLQDFLDIEGGSIKLAAAQALGVIATSEALIGKVIKTQDLSTDGAKVAAELRARAAELRQQVADGEGDDSVGLDIVDFVPPFRRRYAAEASEVEC